MNKIRAYNCNGLCVEHTCGTDNSHYTVAEINGMEVILNFCGRHATEFEGAEDES